MNGEREKEARVYITLDKYLFSQVLSTMKLKPLLPSLREKKRYLCYEVITPQTSNEGCTSIISLTSEAVEQAITSTYSKIYGLYNLGNAGIKGFPGYYDLKNSRGVVRVHNNYIKQVQACLLFITEMNTSTNNTINTIPVIVRSLLISGNVSKIKKQLASYQQDDIVNASNIRR